MNASTQSSREPLILVPGLLCSPDLWRDQLSGLADLAEPVVTMEHARHDSMAAIAAAILASAPPRFALAGLSMGGYIAFELLRQAPERVTRVAFLDTSARPDTEEQLARRRDLLKMAEIGKFKGITARLLPLFIHPDRLADVALTARIYAMSEVIGKDGFMRQQAAIMGRADSRPGLIRIDMPTLVLCGRQDQLTPLAMAEEIAAGIIGARLEVVEHCGHLPTMERPAEVVRAMRDWLRR